MAMASLAFDTHKAVKLLQDAGADEPLAEAVVATIGDAVGDQVATKADLKTLRQATKADMENASRATKGDMDDLGRELENLGKGQKTLKKELEELPTNGDLKMLEQHLTIRLGGLLVGGIVILATMMQIL